MSAERDRKRRQRAEKIKSEKDATHNIRALPLATTDEQMAVEFLEKQRWGDSPACVRCGSVSVYQMQDRATGKRNKRFLWRCNDCGSQYTVRIGTVFEDSRIPLKHWCYAFWAACASKKGVSALQIRRQTQVSYKSALFMMHRIRYAMEVSPRAPQLTGTVEADETYVGGKTRPLSRTVWSKQKRAGVERAGNPRTPKTPVMAMIQRDGEVRALVVPDVTARTVGDALLTHVHPSANLMTDEGTMYIKIGRPYRSHQAVKHGLHEYVRGDASTNAVESFFSRLKRQLIGTHHAVSKKHLHRYVAEVAFKHNTRKMDDGERVAAAIKGADGKRLMYKEPCDQRATGA